MTFGCRFSPFTDIIIIIVISPPPVLAEIQLSNPILLLLLLLMMMMVMVLHFSFRRHRLNRIYYNSINRPERTVLHLLQAAD